MNKIWNVKLRNEDKWKTKFYRREEKTNLEAFALFFRETNSVKIEEKNLNVWKGMRDCRRWKRSKQTKNGGCERDKERRRNGRFCSFVRSFTFSSLKEWNSMKWEVRILFCLFFVLFIQCYYYSLIAVVMLFTTRDPLTL
jgi:hypothetical protein